MSTGPATSTGHDSIYFKKKKKLSRQLPTQHKQNVYKASP